MTLIEAKNAGLLRSASVPRWISCGQIPGLAAGLNGRTRHFSVNELATIRVYEIGSALGSLDIAAALARMASQHLGAGILMPITYQSDELSVTVDLVAIVAKISGVTRG